MALDQGLWIAAVSPEIGPQFPGHGAGNRAPISGKTPPPEIRAQFGPRVGGIEPATFRLQACVPPTMPNSGGQHGHTSSFATWPSPPAPARPNPKSKRAVWILDLGFWILALGFWVLDFGFWSLDFAFWILDLGFWIVDLGFWILDQFSLRSCCGSPKRPRLDFGSWILDLGFGILDFGLGLGLPNIVWILHKIFPCHADSGRRILRGVLFKSFGSVLKVCETRCLPVPSSKSISITPPRSQSLFFVKS